MKIDGTPALRRRHSLCDPMHAGVIVPVTDPLPKYSRYARCSE